MLILSARRSLLLGAAKLHTGSSAARGARAGHPPGLHYFPAPGMHDDKQPQHTGSSGAAAPPYSHCGAPRFSNTRIVPL